MRRQFVRTVVVAAVFTGFALAGFTADVARTAETRVDPTTGVVRKIKRYQRATWRWQRLMGVPRTPNRRRYLKIRDREYRVQSSTSGDGEQPGRSAGRTTLHTKVRGAASSATRGLGAIHTTRTGEAQMDRTFMRQYAPRHLLRRGWANTWTPIEQMWVAERAIRAGRGFYPWPHTGRMCGLI